MLEKTNQDQELISLESLATLTGFPVKMIKEELFSSEVADEKVSLDELRKAMVSYIDATMLEETDS
ncbi:MAG: hypothetical protein CME64_10545 [Halobacteriovoraceae bacterium]|nr:hypothetical protein [Halobacteriovoraceae bacterium]|tara:strand:+ start:40244 stop:40441 length:198 start_codon:yes stop_codon:yes gene_type:complete